MDTNGDGEFGAEKLEGVNSASDGSMVTWDVYKEEANRTVFFP